jgi:hypothetical protein
MGHGGQTAHLLLGLLKGLSLSTESRITQTGAARGALFALTETALVTAAIAGAAEFVVAPGWARAVNRGGGAAFGLSRPVITAHGHQFFGRGGGLGRHHGRSFGFDRGLSGSLVQGGIGWRLFWHWRSGIWGQLKRGIGRRFSSDPRVARPLVHRG